MVLRSLSLSVDWNKRKKKRQREREREKKSLEREAERRQVEFNEIQAVRRSWKFHQQKKTTGHDLESLGATSGMSRLYCLCQKKFYVGAKSYMSVWRWE
jgi:hypothetical protein